MLMILPIARNLHEQQKGFELVKMEKSEISGCLISMSIFLNLIEVLPAAASSLSLASAFPYVCMSLGRAWVFGFGLPTSSLSSSTLYFRDYVLLANLADVARY